LRADAAKGRLVESINRTVSPILRRRPASPCPACARTAAKTPAAAAAIGVGQGGAAHPFDADVIEPPPMARHRRLDVAQRGGAGKLPNSMAIN